MTAEARAKMIATPCDVMPASLIREYTHSAHGVPANADDLRALLPRYMELIAQGEDVDDFGMGSQLRRFGQAIAEAPEFLTPAQQEAYDAWARALLRTWPIKDAPEPGEETLLYPLVLLLAGGVRADAILPEMFDLMEEDPRAAGSVAEDLLHRFSGVDLLDLHSLRDAPAPQRSALVDWLRSNEVRDLLDIASTDPDLPGQQSEAARIVAARLERVALRS